ncbi:hypothetical protein OC846_006338 [Tilletia horrida]|uniref:H-type lectin domain-containing protein n=1 Tax=Tilletia horrida TaxID=155126 RepID=A0AAN6GLU3_9BASI|nr:hypothetical protein OC846_006338 [Tilletia horrida]
MRLGQGFNSYTHQICVDNAVVVDPQRAENIVSNNGTTMRILAQTEKKASLWRQLQEYVNDNEVVPQSKSTEPNLEDRPPPKTAEEEEEEEEEIVETEDSGAASKDKYRGSAHTKEAEAEAERLAAFEQAKRDQAAKKAAEEKTGTKPANQAAKPVTETKPAPTPASKPAQPSDKQVDDAIAAGKESEKAETEKRKAGSAARLDEKSKEMTELPNVDKAIADKHKIEQDKLKERGTGINVKSGKQYRWTKEDAGRGVSQTVTYAAQFIDKLSEVNKDMGGSAALLITGSKFTGSGNAAFVDTERFYGSDLRFYLSIKVINQSINFKDALEYNPIRSVSETDTKQFNEVFGDSFISGFIEGGELNAVVMIKIITDAKKTDISAEARVALTVGQNLDIDGAGNLAIAKKNLAMNTEISINVSWAGGGSIKPYDEEWSIDSLMAAANRFPYLVSRFPQRTHAILTKYSALRSFVMLKAPSISPLQYENATIYTDTLLDYYLEYTLLAKRVSADIGDVQKGLKRFKVIPPTAKGAAPVQSNSLRSAKQPDGLPLVPFAGTLEGLDLARKGIRAQINAIVHEVNELTKFPHLAIQKRDKTFVGPASFQSLIPEVEYKIRRMRTAALTNTDLTKDPKSKGGDDGLKGNLEPHLFDPSSSTLALSEQEQIQVAGWERDNPELGEVTRVSPPVGSLTAGDPFSTIEIGLEDPVLSEISVGKFDKVVRSLSVTYSNGFSMEFGDKMRDYIPHDPEKTVKDHDKVRYTLTNLGTAEMIVSAKIEVDGAGNEDTVSVIGVRFVTNKGQVLEALSTAEHTRHYEVHSFEKPICDGYISGFWGRAKAPEKPVKQGSKAAPAAASAEKKSATEAPASSTATAAPTSSGEKTTDDKAAAAGSAKQVDERLQSDPFGRITKLGLVWTQAFAKDTMFDDEAPIECLTSWQPLAPSTDKTAVKYGRILPGEPQLIWGMQKLELTGSPAAECKASLEMQKLEQTDPPAAAGHKETSEGRSTSFSYTTTSAKNNAKAHMGWMVVPELKDVNIQSGEVVIEADGKEASETVNFTYPFKNKEKIVIVCWLIDFETTGPVLDVQAAVVPSLIECKSFTIKICANDGDVTTTSTKKDIGAQKVTVGWLAYDKPADGKVVDFQAGTQPCEVGPKGKTFYIPKLENLFTAEPEHHFVALRSVRCALDGKETIFKGEVTERTAQKFKLEVQSKVDTKFDYVWIGAV